MGLGAAYEWWRQGGMVAGSGQFRGEEIGKLPKSRLDAAVKYMMSTTVEENERTASILNSSTTIMTITTSITLQLTYISCVYIPMYYVFIS